METKTSNRTKKIVKTAMLTALMAVLAQVSIPLPGGVPLSFGVLAVFLCGAILGSKGGALAQTIYLLLGAVGAPVFANFTGGLGIVIGKTGGYLIGYIIAAFITGFMIEKFGRKIHVYIIGMLVGLIACYVFGTAWFMVLTKLSLAKSLTYCVIPFIPLDLLKIVLATMIAKSLEKVIK